MNTIVEKVDTLKFVSDWFVPIIVFVGIVLLVHTFILCNVYERLRFMKHRLAKFEQATNKKDKVEKPTS